MKASEMLELLREFHRDKLAQRQRHVAAARHVPHYDFNNTYQYVIAREDMHVRWLQDALAHLGGTFDEVPEPDIRPDGKGEAAQRAILTADRDGAQKFVDAWRARIDTIPNGAGSNSFQSASRFQFPAPSFRA
ncbi:MAG: hypothetical protein LC753_05050 [Acidobacteria bacterium]|nr:hypothetical protein [Acidobacteriota bacterium]